MIRPRPGWLVVLAATVLAVSAWLPWLSTTANGGGRANAAGGTHGTFELPGRFGIGQLIVLLASVLLVVGAMAARGISARWAAGVAVAVSVGIAALTGWYYRLHVAGSVSASYGWYLGVVATAAALGFSVWALVDVVRAGRGPR